MTSNEIIPLYGSARCLASDFHLDFLPEKGGEVSLPLTSQRSGVQDKQYNSLDFPDFSGLVSRLDLLSPALV